MRDEYVVASATDAANGKLSGIDDGCLLQNGVKDKDQFFDLPKRANGNLDYYCFVDVKLSKQINRNHIEAD